MGMTSQLYVNGKVFTGRGEDDFVTAFEITDGVFSWTGDMTGDGRGLPSTSVAGRCYRGCSTSTPTRPSCPRWSTR